MTGGYPYNLIRILSFVINKFLIYLRCWDYIYFCLNTCTVYVQCNIRTSFWVVKYKTFCVGSNTSKCVWPAFVKYAVTIIAGFWVFIRYCTTLLVCKTFRCTFRKTIFVALTKRQMVLPSIRTHPSTPSIISSQGYSLIYLKNVNFITNNIDVWSIFYDRRGKII